MSRAGSCAILARMVPVCTFNVQVKRNGLRSYGIGSRTGTLDQVRHEVEDLVYDISHYTDVWLEHDGRRVAAATADTEGRLTWWQ